MPIGDAKRFINQIMKDPGLRDDFIRIASKKEMELFWSKYGFRFTGDEFENGFNNLLCNCQHQSLAELYYQIKYLYDTIVYQFEGG